MIKKVCLTCGNGFHVPKHRKHSAKFCSVECAHALGRTNRECLFCGKPFTAQKHRDRRYCSKECATNIKKKRVMKPCAICGKEYEVQQYCANTSKYCSIQCRSIGIGKALIGRFKGEKSPTYKGGKITRLCKYCGKKFKVDQYRGNTANHCSTSCSKLGTSEKTRKQIAESIKKLQRENPKLHPNYILAQKGHITQIEKLIKDGLTKRKLSFETQYRILSYWVDFAFPNIKLVVECDGERWHSTKEQLLKDKQKDEKLTNVGWKVLRFREKEILKDSKEVVNKIENFIKK